MFKTIKDTVFNFLNKYKIFIGIGGILLFLYLLFVTHEEVNTVGIARNFVSGKIELLLPGYHITSPAVQVSNIDIAPVRVQVQSAANARSMMLVQFDTTHWKEFIKVEGFHYYWWYNRFSFNIGYDDEYRGFKDVLRGFAFSTEKYKFIKIIEK